MAEGFGRRYAGGWRVAALAQRSGNALLGDKRCACFIELEPVDEHNRGGGVRSVAHLIYLRSSAAIWAHAGLLVPWAQS